MDMMMMRSLAGRRVVMELLWENASPGSNMGADADGVASIAIDWSQYDLIAIHVAYTAGGHQGDVYFVSEVCPVALASLRLPNYDTYRTRQFTMIDGGIKVGAGYRVAGSTVSSDASSAVPMRVYGIKGVLYDEA